MPIALAREPCIPNPKLMAPILPHGDFMFAPPAGDQNTPGSGSLRAPTRRPNRATCQKPLCAAIEASTFFIALRALGYRRRRKSSADRGSQGFETELRTAHSARRCKRIRPRVLVPSPTYAACKLLPS
jgi:hypothetical protein